MNTGIRTTVPPLVQQFLDDAQRRKREEEEKEVRACASSSSDTSFPPSNLPSGTINSMNQMTVTSSSTSLTMADAAAWIETLRTAKAKGPTTNILSADTSTNDRLDLAPAPLSVASQPSSLSSTPQSSSLGPAPLSSLDPTPLSPLDPAPLSSLDSSEPMPMPEAVPTTSTMPVTTPQVLGISATPRNPTIYSFRSHPPTRSLPPLELGDAMQPRPVLPITIDASIFEQFSATDARESEGKSDSPCAALAYGRLSTMWHLTSRHPDTTSDDRWLRVFRAFLEQLSLEEPDIGDRVLQGWHDLICMALSLPIPTTATDSDSGTDIIVTAAATTTTATITTATTTIIPPPLPVTEPTVDSMAQLRASLSAHLAALPNLAIVVSVKQLVALDAWLQIHATPDHLEIYDMLIDSLWTCGISLFDGQRELMTADGKVIHHALFDPLTMNAYWNDTARVTHVDGWATAIMRPTLSTRVRDQWDALMSELSGDPNARHRLSFIFNTASSSSSPITAGMQTDPRSLAPPPHTWCPRWMRWMALTLVVVGDSEEWHLQHRVPHLMALRGAYDIAITHVLPNQMGMRRRLDPCQNDLWSKLEVQGLLIRDASDAVRISQQWAGVVLERDAGMRWWPPLNLTDRLRYLGVDPHAVMEAIEDGHESDENDSVGDEVNSKAETNETRDPVRPSYHRRVYSKLVAQYDASVDHKTRFKTDLCDNNIGITVRARHHRLYLSCAPLQRESMDAIDICDPVHLRHVLYNPLHAKGVVYASPLWHALLASTH